MRHSLDRRSFLNCGAAVIGAAALRDATNAFAQEPRRERTKRILAIGGGAFVADTNRLLLRYWLSLTGKEEPVVCLLGTAQGDHPETIVTWYETMNQLPCRPRHLRLFGPTKNLRDFAAQLLPVDGIFVRGGNAVNMLAIWKAQGIDTILRTAWERGIVLAGESAGMVCWFEQSLSDSRPDRLTPLECLGWLKGSACPHMDTEPQRRPTYQKMITDGELREGIACDDEAALLFEGEQLVKAVSSSPKAAAYRVFRKEGHVVEERMAMELLGKESEK